MESKEHHVSKGGLFHSKQIHYSQQTQELLRCKYLLYLLTQHQYITKNR